MSRSLRPIDGGASRPDLRRAAIKKVHARARERGLDEASRRDIQLRVTGLESCRDMSLDQLQLVLQELGSGRAARQDPRHVRKIRALWLSLHHLGEVRDGAPQALDAFVRRQSGVSALRFLSARDAGPVIEALKDWCLRAGYEVVPDSGETRQALLARQWQILVEREAVPAGSDLDGWLVRTMGLREAAWLTAQEADRAIAVLGGWIRRAGSAATEGPERGEEDVGSF